MISIPSLQRNQNLKLFHVSCSPLSLNYNGNTWITIPFRASGYSLGKWPLCFQADTDSLPFESFHYIHFYHRFLFRVITLHVIYHILTFSCSYKNLWTFQEQQPCFSQYLQRYQITFWLHNNKNSETWCRIQQH